MEQRRHEEVLEGVTHMPTHFAVAETSLGHRAGCDGGATELLGESPSTAVSSLGYTSFTAGAHDCGSFGHPELCAKPCVAFSFGHCSNGASCGFCHLPHEARVAHLDKRGREGLKRMTREERAANLLPIIRQKVIQLRLHQDCVETIDDMLNSVGRYAESSGVGMKRGPWTKFKLRALLCMLGTDRDLGSSQLQNQMHMLVNKLRASFAAQYA
eukprot:TRINITY_DN14369_c0_g1_i1.p2 TRINITY_DN14369_c0_g1~~TRINITY_DN14369_c0_g1_i1.p2  ORF type:complete len:213 (+),score=28.81 TRINITY_DN14369_c0_g1_i1:944-1582(+)